ncbi:MAG: hypothetical protein E5W75_18960 [Mesorhizobium sp.]|nr:MAG: hypothetical protein E5W75_18960 [Mesorhizobium sp.]
MSSNKQTTVEIKRLPIPTSLRSAMTIRQDHVTVALPWGGRQLAMKSAVLDTSQGKTATF